MLVPVTSLLSTVRQKLYACGHPVGEFAALPSPYKVWHLPSFRQEARINRA